MVHRNDDDKDLFALIMAGVAVVIVGLIALCLIIGIIVLVNTLGA